MADPDLQIREGVGGGGEGRADPDPDIRERGRSQKNFFRPFGPQFSLKIRGGGGAPRHFACALGFLSMPKIY